MKKSDQIKNLFPTKFHPLLSSLSRVIQKLQEIRIRVLCPCIFIIGKKEYYPDFNGVLSEDIRQAYVFSEEDVDMIFNHICDYSPYAYESQLKQGFMTVAGGHRVGVGGQVVLENGRIAMMKKVAFLHIRVVHEVLGAGDEILPYLFEKKEFLNTLIISSPGAGKTTMLRDLTRSLSDGSTYADGKQICVIDERSELAGCYMGIPQNHIGIRTDVLDACPKADGMMMAIRSMGPEILVVDELGLKKDYEALDMASVCGIRLLASVHGNCLSQILAKENTYQDVMKRIFQRIILLKWRRDRDGEKKQIWQIYDIGQKLLAEKKGG